MIIICQYCKKFETSSIHDLEEHQEHCQAKKEYDAKVRLEL